MGTLEFYGERYFSVIGFVGEILAGGTTFAWEVDNSISKTCGNLWCVRQQASKTYRVAAIATGFPV